MKRGFSSGLKWAIKLLVLVVCLDAVAGATHYYRWLNARGEPVHSDRPPPSGVDYEVISTGSSFKRVVSSEEGVVPLETTPNPSNQFDQVDAQAAARSVKNQELCDRARANLAALNSSEKVEVRNEQGEMRYLTPEEILVERQTARAQLSVYCE